MKACFLFLLLGASPAWAQTPPPAAGDSDKVVAIFEDGTKMTQGQLQALIPVLPDSLRPLAMQDPQKFLHWYGVARKAAGLFQTEKLADKPALQLEMEFTILEKKADLYVRDAAGSIVVTPEELQKYYDDHKDLYKRVKASGLEVAFSSAPAAEPNASSLSSSRASKPARTEEEAKAKAEKLIAELRAGADFAKIEQAEDDNDDLKAKHGDEGTWGMQDNVPDLIRANVLSLKEGEVSEPIRQNGGFFIVHADSITYSPLADVKDEIFAYVQQQKAKDWLARFDHETKVEFPDKEPSPPAAPSDPKK